MSTGKGFQGWDKDRKFLRYLWDNKHTSPFEHAGMTVQVTCDLASARQWMRHRTFSYNEKSLRYSEADDAFLNIATWRGQSTVNKQGSDGVAEGSFATEYYQDSCQQALDTYHQLLSQGVAREQARMVLPLSTMTTFRAQAVLWNWMRFLQLRNHHHAQPEIRGLAVSCAEMIKQQFPETYEVAFGEQVPSEKAA